MSVYGKLIKNPLVSTVMSHIEVYPTPINLTYLWGFGSLAGVALVVQIVTGVLLAMHYAAEVHLAFASVEHIMRDVKGGVILRYIHANGASMFLLIVYLHMFRGLYYGSYYQPRANLWYSGVVIFLAMMATAFMGYVLPWGQMSFWGATVITNLFSAIPYIGDSIVQLLWGGFSVDNPTLNRFFSLHYFVPFIIAGLAFLHLILLHQPGSNNPLGVNAIYDRIPFYPYFYVKDLFGFFIFVWIFSFFVIYAPNYLGHPDNYIEANPLVTPAHIVPEWYFLPFYAILRSIPDKLGGVVFMVAAIVILALLPVVDTSAFRSNYFKPFNIWIFWFFFADSISLGWIGQEVVETPFMEMGIFVTFCYFFHFIALLPFGGFLENAVINYELRYSSFFAPLNNNFNAQANKDARWELTQQIIANSRKSLEEVASGGFSHDYNWDVLAKMAKIPDPWFLEQVEKHPEWVYNNYYGEHVFSFPERWLKLKEYWTSEQELWRDFNYDFHNDIVWFKRQPYFDLYNFDFIWDWKNTFFAQFKWLEFYQISFVFLFLLFLSLFFSRRGEFTRFINKLSFSYLIFVFWRFSFELVLTPKELVFAALPKPTEKYSFDRLVDFNNWDISFNVPVLGDQHISSWFLAAQESGEQSFYEWLPLYNFISTEDIYLKLFAIYAILIVSIFFYGVSDRFFVANSYEIEFTLLVFFSHLGALFLFSVQNFIEFVLAIEVVTLATYALTAFDRRNRFSTHAGVQYFILGSIPSGLLVLGLALIYKSWGTLGFNDLDLLLTNVSESRNYNDALSGLLNNNLSLYEKKDSVWDSEINYLKLFEDIPAIDVIGMEHKLTFYDDIFVFPPITEQGHYTICIREKYQADFAKYIEENLLNPLVPLDWVNFDNNLFPEMDAAFAASATYSFATLAAIFLIFFNFLFKITAAPFHFWAPSIYGKAPVASVTFLSIFSKAMIFFAIAKFLISIFHAYSFIFLPFLIFISVLSVLFGMIGAFAEKGIKRFFVYSSMGHVGFMLLGLGLSTKEGLSATFHYLPVYIITSFIMWFILMYLGEEKNQLIHFSILKNSNPLLALIFSLIIFSMSGIPPLGGFFVKLDVLSALLESSKFYINYILLLFTVASFFYYLRVVKIIFFDKNRDFSINVYGSEERLWMISLLFIILLFYLFLVEKPLLEIQLEALSSIY